MEPKKTTYQPHGGKDFIADAMLSCPCCGGEPELKFKGNDYTKSRSVTIKCKKCRLQRVNATIRHDAEWCAKVAIKQWNKRIDRENLTDKILLQAIIDILKNSQ